jgi:hypothetical protein
MRPHHDRRRLALHFLVVAHNHCDDLLFLETQGMRPVSHYSWRACRPFFIISLRCKQLVVGEEDCEVAGTLRNML